MDGEQALTELPSERPSPKHCGRELLGRNIERVLENIELARRIRGTGEPVRLVAVTKTVDSETAAELVRLGQVALGENRVQEWRRKCAYFAEAGLEAEWHIIGRLQCNKLKYLAGKPLLIHSVDSTHLLSELSQLGCSCGRVFEVLLELNISGEQSKTGFTPSALPGVLDSLDEYRGVRVRGYMTMAPKADDIMARRVFAEARRLYELNPAFDVLSMGMSGDYRIAVEEGATLVRVGTALYEED